MSQSDDTIDPLCYTAADEAESPTGGGADTVVADDGQLLPAAVPLQPIERYDVIEVIASGGMGTVWLARDKLLERDVALKILHRTLEGSPKARQRFEAEARLTGRLDHPGIVPVYDCGRLESGRWYFAMRRIHGVDLREHIDSFRADGQKEYPLNALLRLFSQVCLIVAYAHDRGCVHRDLKPANILVGAYGELYVADWGIAKVVRDAAIDNSSQKDGVDVPRDEHGIVGTAKYMSPEHVLVGSVELTAKSDVFSLGIMLVELVTGRFPFAGQNGVELMQAIVDGRRVDTPSMSNGQAVPDLLRELFDDVLAPDPTARPTAVELASRIGEYLDGVEDRRRAVAKAHDCLSLGLGFLAQYRDGQKHVDARRDELLEAESKLREEDILADDVGSGKALEPYLDLWSSGREVELSIRDVEHAYSRAVQALEQCLENADLDAAHDALADLYWDKYADAKKAGERANALYFRALVEEHDRGLYTDRLAETGTIVLPEFGDAMAYHIERYVEQGPLLVPETVENAESELDVGSYRLVVGDASGQTVYMPFNVSGNQRAKLTKSLPVSTVDGFQFISGGDVMIGGDSEAPNGLEPTTVTLQPYWIATFPVTVGDYLEFLNALALDDPAKARSHAPRSPAGTCYIDLDADTGQFVVPTEDTDGDAWDLKWPIMMVNQHDALAYCRWLSERDGRPYRLPSEFEWEFAARGVDGRIFPWGNGYDRLISCSSRGMNNDKTKSGQRNGPARIDEFPYDVSPFGVRHMGGLAIEWTSTVNFAGNVIMRGGGLFATEAWCRAATRYAHAPERLGVQFGFRIALTAEG